MEKRNEIVRISLSENLFSSLLFLLTLVNDGKNVPDCIKTSINWLQESELVENKISLMINIGYVDYIVNYILGSSSPSQ